MSLSCGGRGPCCHIGYAHRHCEHCDTVIPTYHAHYQQPWPWYQQPWYSTLGGLLNSQSATIVDINSHTHEEAS